MSECKHCSLPRFYLSSPCICPAPQQSPIRTATTLCTKYFRYHHPPFIHTSNHQTPTNNKQLTEVPPTTMCTGTRYYFWYPNSLGPTPNTQCPYTPSCPAPDPARVDAYGNKPLS